MAQLHDIITWCDQQLKTTEFKDYAPNGLQVEGKAHIQTLATAVTASLDAIEQAIQLGADALLVHHGYFWKGEADVLTGMKGKRIKALMQHDLSLIAYHLPLDAHQTWGNNVAIAERLGLSDLQHLNAQDKHPIGQIGLLAQPLSAQEFQQLLRQAIQVEHSDTPILHLAANKTHIQKVGFCTGAAQDYIHQAAAMGCDAFISGEVSERTFYEAKELDVHYYACGHHATERYGVQRLGEALAKQFGITHHYIELHNPI
ncbi:MAG: Nif3-like dinuclear metal center hexameric protein [Acinetobacter sp.]|nr:Nif3-like dinuclear metal center hexameric protein [Acinetobacter sp.]